MEENLELMENEDVMEEETEDFDEVEEGKSNTGLLALGGVLAAGAVGAAATFVYKKFKKGKNGEAKPKRKLKWVEVDEDGNIIDSNTNESDE